MDGEFDELKKAPASFLLPLGLAYLAAVGTKKTEVQENHLVFALTPDAFGDKIN